MIEAIFLVVEFFTVGNRFFNNKRNVFAKYGGSMSSVVFLIALAIIGTGSTFIFGIAIMLSVMFPFQLYSEYNKKYLHGRGFVPKKIYEAAIEEERLHLEEVMEHDKRTLQDVDGKLLSAEFARRLTTYVESDNVVVNRKDLSD